MRPPMCDLCKGKFSPSHDGGGTVRFANYEPLPKGMVGHPKGLVWFCAEHIEAAKALNHLDHKEAMQQLRQEFETDAK